jgi:hypothetical protein
MLPIYIVSKSELPMARASKKPVQEFPWRITRIKSSPVTFRPFHEGEHAYPSRFLSDGRSAH